MAFAALLDHALDRYIKEVSFTWEDAGDEDCIYYDVAVISDGLRSANIPAPLLKEPLQFRKVCDREVAKPIHNRAFMRIRNKILLRDYCEALKDELLAIAPEAPLMAHKYLAQRECVGCEFFSAPQTNGALYCTVHPLGYPGDMCLNWNPSNGYEATLGEHL